MKIRNNFRYIASFAMMFCVIFSVKYVYHGETNINNNGYAHKKRNVINTSENGIRIQSTNRDSHIVRSHIYESIYKDLIGKGKEITNKNFVFYEDDRCILIKVSDKEAKINEIYIRGDDFGVYKFTKDGRFLELIKGY